MTPKISTRVSVRGGFAKQWNRVTTKPTNVLEEVLLYKVSNRYPQFVNMCLFLSLCSMLNFHSYAWIATTYSCLILLHKDLLLRSLHLLQLLHPLDCQISRSTRTPNAESLTLEPSRNGRLHRIGLSIIIWNQEEEEFSKHNLYVCKGLIDGIKSFTFWSRLMDPNSLWDPTIRSAHHFNWISYFTLHHQIISNLA